ncbi:MAG: methyltransferase domain-containing protein [Nakamurella sp.]
MFDVTVGFNVTAIAYGRFMGRYSEPLAGEFLPLLRLDPGDRVLDVGCGPGALTERLVRVVGATGVAAVDPSEPFVAATRERLPDIDVRRAPAERLPFGDDEFDCAAAQLVVHFMKDPVAGLTEMARVTRSGGLIAANVWDHAGGAGPLSTFWHAVAALDPDAADESRLAGARQGHLVELFGKAGLHDVTETVLTVRVEYLDFEQWWNPFTLGVGPAGAYVAKLDEQQRAQLKAQCASLLPPAPFEIAASAWTALGRV